MTAVRRSAPFVFAAVFLMLSGCDEERVDGQVVAVVNGEEITVSELNEEARARGLAIGNDRALRDALVKELVDRKLLVQAAEQRKLDRTPEHLLAQRRSEEILLAGELIAVLARQRTQPSEGDVVQFIKSRPFAFEQRALLTVDRIRAPAGIEADLARILKDAPSLDHAQAQLASNQIRTERRTEIWDSATLPKSIAEQLLDAPNSGNMVFQLPSETLVTRVLETVPQPTPAADSRRLARELIHSEWSQQLLQAIIAQQRSEAKIRYQPQFAPPENRPGS